MISLQVLNLVKGSLKHPLICNPCPFSPTDPDAVVLETFGDQARLTFKDVSETFAGNGAALVDAVTRMGLV